MASAGYGEFSSNDGRVFRLRPLKRGDLEALLSFANGIARERRTNRELGIVSLDRWMTRQDEKRFLERQLKGMKKKRLVSVAAFYGRDLVGHCDVTGRESRDLKHTGVLGIVIAEGYRGVGLGERLVRTALEQSAKLGIWLVELTVFSSNSRARALYRRAGFEDIGTIPKKIRRDGKFIDEVIMCVQLPHNR